MPPPPQQFRRPASWMQRNWKWTLSAVLLLFLGMVAVLYAVVRGFLKSSEVYTEAIAIVRDDSTVRNALGEPLEEGFFLTGEISVSDSGGRATLDVPISGSKTEGTLYIRAVKQDGRWHFRQLVVEVSDTGNLIELTAQPPPRSELHP